MSTIVTRELRVRTAFEISHVLKSLNRQKEKCLAFPSLLGKGLLVLKWEKEHRNSVIKFENKQQEREMLWGLKGNDQTMESK